MVIAIIIARPRPRIATVTDEAAIMDIRAAIAAIGRIAIAEASRSISATEF